MNCATIDNTVTNWTFHFPLKFTDTPKFETINPTISVNVLVHENNEVFPLYASKHRDRKYHVNVLIISNNEGKFHYLLVRNLSLCRRPHELSTSYISLSVLSLLLLESSANRSPPGLFRSPQADGGISLTRRSRKKYQKVELCHCQFTTKNQNMKDHCHLSEHYIRPYCITCNLKLK